MKKNKLKTCIEPETFYIIMFLRFHTRSHVDIAQMLIPISYIIIYNENYKKKIRSLIISANYSMIIFDEFCLVLK